MRHVPRKRFGQHFLTDRGIIEDIVQSIDPMPGQVVVEIGPGLGAMTQPLVKRLGHMTVIELDRDLALLLRNELEQRLASKKWTLEWDDIIRDLSNLVEMKIAINGKGYAFRGQTSGVAGKVFQACGVALPPTLRSC